jgi:hypothetical protein
MACRASAVKADRPNLLHSRKFWKILEKKSIDTAVEPFYEFYMNFY